MRAQVFDAVREENLQAGGLALSDCLSDCCGTETESPQGGAGGHTGTAGAGSRCPAPCARFLSPCSLSQALRGAPQPAARPAQVLVQVVASDDYDSPGYAPPRYSEAAGSPDALAPDPGPALGPPVKPGAAGGGGAAGGSLAAGFQGRPQPLERMDIGRRETETERQSWRRDECSPFVNAVWREIEFSPPSMLQHSHFLCPCWW